MKKLSLALIFLFPTIVLAQVASPAPSPVPSAPASGALFSPALLAVVVGVVLSLNVALSAVQQIFSQWAKQEPSWLQKLSSVVAKVAQYLGSNPSL